MADLRVGLRNGFLISLGIHFTGVVSVLDGGAVLALMPELFFIIHGNFPVQ
jgi:hypothetical protein